MKKDGNKKFDVNETIEYLKSPKGKMVAFFGFYFIFFLVLAILARVNPGTTNSYNDTNAKKFDFSLEKIANNNYHFNYSLEVANNKYLYEGDRKDNNELFSFNTLNYYRNSDNYLINNSGNWVNTTNPYIMQEFIDISSISRILDLATYISKTDYESGIKTYNYEVSTTTLVKLFDNVDIDLDDDSNNLFIKADENNNVDEIEFELNNYCVYKGVGNNCRIDLNYSNFEQIEEVKNPLS